MEYRFKSKSAELDAILRALVKAGSSTPPDSFIVEGSAAGLYRGSISAPPLRLLRQARLVAVIVQTDVMRRMTAARGRRLQLFPLLLKAKCSGLGCRLRRRK